MPQQANVRAVLPTMVLPAFVTSLFGGVWLALAVPNLHLPAVVLFLLLALILVAFVALFVSSIRFARDVWRVSTGKSPLRERRRMFIYVAAIAFEFVAYLVGYNVLRSINRLDLVLPWLVFVVGLHFFGLIPVFRTNRYVMAAMVFCLSAIIAAFLPVTINAAGLSIGIRNLLVGLVCGAYMWYVCARILAQGRRWIREIDGLTMQDRQEQVSF